MTDPADHSVRSLAEILREHGLESDAGTRPGTTGPVRAAQRKRRVEDPPSTRPEAADRDRRTGSSPRVTEGTEVVASTTTPPRSRRQAGDTDRPGSSGGGDTPRAGGPTTSAIPGLRAARGPGVPSSTVGSRSGAPDLASTGPIPRIVLPVEEEREPLTPAQSALAWARFVGELVLALAVGVGVYYLFTVLWELLPYLAVALAPLAVTGLVGGVAFWRRRHGQPQLDTRVLLLLLFAGTLLVVVPAAGLLAGS